MSGATSRRKGARWQTAVRKYLAEWASGEVRARSAGEDGDDLACTVAGVHLSVECKDCQTITLAAWVDQAEGNATELWQVPIVVAKRRGHPDPADAYAVLPLHVLLDALGIAHRAGKGTP